MKDKVKREYLICKEKVNPIFFLFLLPYKIFAGYAQDRLHELILFLEQRDCIPYIRLFEDSR